MSKKPSKRYRAAQQVADLKAKYDVNQAAEIIKKMPGTKFDETVEISAFLGVDPKQSDQMVRGTVSLPNGSGKKIKVLAFTENAAEALAAGADYAGLADLIAKVNGGFLDFDVAISTTSAMKDVRQVARVLGPKGLMPNPKSGTVSDDIPKTIKEVKEAALSSRWTRPATSWSSSARSPSRRSSSPRTPPWPSPPSSRPSPLASPAVASSSPSPSAPR
jgi:large subunit ribosomal protein L1